jgi:hypothetical protein
MIRRVMFSLILLFLIAAVAVAYAVYMPGQSDRFRTHPPNADEKEIAATLQRHVKVLAHGIGPRCIERYSGLRAAERYIAEALRAMGHEVRREPFNIDELEVANLSAELPGTADAASLLVIGAHYDGAGDRCPAANDNGSGTAALLVLAERFRAAKFARTLRFSFFVNEEPPWFASEKMGSYVHAQNIAAEKRAPVEMISLETLGYYSDEPGSQKYPGGLGLLFPDRGNFVAFVGNTGSARLVRRAIGAFRKHAAIPSVGIAAPSLIPGISWSDHWAFWQFGFPAIMLTDTAPFRYPHYHLESDTYEKVQYDQLARVTIGVERMIQELLGHGAG